MKKNLMTVLIMALVFVNVVLSAVIMITLVPAAKQSNELITQICGAIDLELESGKVYNVNTIPVDQIELYDLNGGEAQTYNLKDTIAADGTREAHYAVAVVSLSINKEDDDYETLQPLVPEREKLVQELIGETFMEHSYDDIRDDNGQAVKDEMLEKVQELFDSDFIVAVTISNVQYQ